MRELLSEMAHDFAGGLALLTVAVVVIIPVAIALQLWRPVRWCLDELTRYDAGAGYLD